MSASWFLRAWPHMPLDCASALAVFIRKGNLSPSVREGRGGRGPGKHSLLFEFLVLLGWVGIFGMIVQRTNTKKTKGLKGKGSLADIMQGVEPSTLCVL